MSDLMPEGQYQGDVIGAEFGQTSNGNLQMAVKFNIAEGVNRTVYLTMNENTMGTNDEGKPRICQSQLDALGYNGDDPPTFANPNGVQLYMKHDEWNGKRKEKWNVSSGGTPMTPASPDQINRFKSQWRALKGAGPKPASAASAPKAPTRPTSAPAKPKAQDADSVFQLWASGREKAKKAIGESDWFEFCKSVIGNDDTDKYTPGDWQKVAEAADLPF